MFLCRVLRWGRISDNVLDDVDKSRFLRTFFTNLLQMNWQYFGEREVHHDVGQMEVKVIAANIVEMLNPCIV